MSYDQGIRIPLDGYWIRIRRDWLQVAVVLAFGLVLARCKEGYRQK